MSGPVSALPGERRRRVAAETPNLQYQKDNDFDSLLAQGQAMIKGLLAEVSNVQATGPATISASAVRVRYGAADGRGTPRFFDSVE
jgi:hypothetical protein